MYPLWPMYAGMSETKYLYQKKQKLNLQSFRIVEGLFYYIGLGQDALIEKLY